MNRPSFSPIVYLGYIGGLILIYMLLLRKGITPALLFAGLPFLVLCGLGLMQKLYSFYFFFILNYFIAGLGRYFPLKIGVIMLAMALLLLLLVLVRGILVRQEWQRCKNLLTAVWSFWAVYCLLELLNPRALLEPWSIAFPNYAFYPLVCALLVPVLFTQYKNFRILLILWAVLTLLAAAKGYWQKNRGFDSTELAWLYSYGQSTHLIRSGIRFFSFFSDAANYGASMGLSLVIFGIAAFYTRKMWVRILFWTAALGGAYGLIISGTRSDLAIPFVGLFVFLLLCRNLKAIFVTAAILAGAFVFFNYTTIGDNNRYIHRMRTAFDYHDASLAVRKNNRKKIFRLMEDKPFGVGLGLAGKKAERFREVNKFDPLTYLATDSWFVMTWVETGLIGLLLYLMVWLALLIRGAQIALFQIKNKELQGTLYGIIGGIAGILVSCYANEVLNYPNGILVYTLAAFLFIAPYYDKELNAYESRS